jgi:hypothetical protein
MNNKDNKKKMKYFICLEVYWIVYNFLFVFSPILELLLFVKKAMVFKYLHLLIFALQLPIPPSRQLCVNTDIDFFLYIYIFMIEINSFELIISKTKFHPLRHL